MSRSPHRVRRVLSAVVVVAVVVGLVRRTSRGRVGTNSVLPDIGGDTWPPVPVKETPPG
jgi:hypothetical protein